MAENYRLIQARTANDFEKKVNAALEDGFSLHQGHALMGGIHTQVVVKGGDSPSPSGDGYDGVGSFQYNNGAPLYRLVTNAWNGIKNDGAGARSSSAMAPPGVASMLSKDDGRILLDSLSVGDQVFMRHVLSLTPLVNGLRATFQNVLGSGPDERAEPFGPRVVLDGGAGTPTGPIAVECSLVVDSDNTRLSGFIPQIRVNGNCDMEYKGVYISVVRRPK